MARNTARAEVRSSDDWFAPKRYGYGSSLPIAWQGWLVCLAYAVAVTVAALLLPQRSMAAFIAVIVVATGTLLVICARKTRGGWKWRRGDGA